MSETKLQYFEFEIPILEALDEMGGQADIKKVYRWVQKNKKDIFKKYPEILGRYKDGNGDIIWKNKLRWAREYMKRKEQLSFPERAVWKITNTGKERLKEWKKTGRDPDAGLENHCPADRNPPAYNDRQWLGTDPSD